jgi:hypothetical protein
MKVKAATKGDKVKAARQLIGWALYTYAGLRPESGGRLLGRIIGGGRHRFAYRCLSARAAQLSRRQWEARQ